MVGAILATMRVPAEGKAMQAALAGLCALAGEDLARRPLPPLYRAGVRYRPEPRGQERWQVPSEVKRKGFGDCEDLAAWRVAELRRKGEAAMPYVKQTGARRWHAMVKRADGRLEDPSRLLGMGQGGDEMAGEGEDGNVVRWRVQRIPDGWSGVLTMPFKPGVVKKGTLKQAVAKVKGKSKSKPGLAKKLAKGAFKMATNPTVASLLAPGVGPAAATALRQMAKGKGKKK